jgi:dolichol kinase
MNTRIADLEGTLILGVGDSLASIVGSKFGTMKWHTDTKKSVQGTTAALLGMTVVLRIYGTLR